MTKSATGGILRQNTQRNPNISAPPLSLNFGTGNAQSALFMRVCARWRSALNLGQILAAQVLSFSQRALDYLIANRRLATKRIGGRVLIPVAGLRKSARGGHAELIVA